MKTLAEIATWIDYIGEPMRRDVDGLRRMVWWVGGAGVGSGAVLGLLLPYILKKLGLS